MRTTLPRIRSIFPAAPVHVGPSTTKGQHPLLSFLSRLALIAYFSEGPGVGRTLLPLHAYPWSWLRHPAHQP